MISFLVLSDCQNKLIFFLIKYVGIFLICFEDDVIDFTVVFDEMKLHPFLDKVCQFLYVSLVGLWEYDAGHVSSFGLWRNSHMTRPPCHMRLYYTLKT